MRILALDPANATGFCHSNGESGTWHLFSRRRGQHAGARLSLLATWLREWHARMPYDIIAYEDASFGGINRNTQAAHNEIAGIIKMVASELGVNLIAYKPASIKSFAGIVIKRKQRVSKDASITACQRLFNRFPRDDNEADAILICEMVKAGYQPQKSACKRRRPANPLQGKLFGKVRRAPMK